MTETRNYYTSSNYTYNHTNHSAFGGLIYLGDFCTEYPQPKGTWSNRIISDMIFNEQCKRNAKNRDRQKNYRRKEMKVQNLEIGNEIEEQKYLEEKSYKVEKGKVAYRTVYYCGNCGDYVGDTDTEQYDFCPHCRVLLDWSNID